MKRLKNVVRRAEYCGSCKKLLAVRAYGVDGNWVLPLTAHVNTKSGCCNNNIVAIIEVASRKTVFDPTTYPKNEAQWAQEKVYLRRDDETGWRRVGADMARDAVDASPDPDPDESPMDYLRRKMIKLKKDMLDTGVDEEAFDTAVIDAINDARESTPAPTPRAPSHTPEPAKEKPIWAKFREVLKESHWRATDEEIDSLFQVVRGRVDDPQGR